MISSDMIKIAGDNPGNLFKIAMHGSDSLQSWPNDQSQTQEPGPEEEIWRKENQLKKRLRSKVT